MMILTTLTIVITAVTIVVMTNNTKGANNAINR